METIQPESADTPDDKPPEPTAPEHKQEKQQ
jgi:hypothetical protein